MTNNKREKLEFIVCSDLHFHSHSNYSEDTGTLYFTSTKIIEGVNSRLCNTVNAFIEMLNYAEQHNISHILIAGDLVHDKKRITKDVLSALVLCFSQAYQRDISFHVISGNHDQANKDGTNSTLALLHPYPNIDTNPGFNYYNFGHVWLGVNCVHYTEDRNCFINQVNHPRYNKSLRASVPCYNILLAHTGIKGAKVGSDYVLIRDEDLDISNINYDKYDACFFGHYHEHQKVFKNGWIPGALEEHNWSDAGGKRGFIHVTLDDNKVDVKHIPTHRSVPRFKLLSVESTLEDIKPWDFIRFITKESITQEHKDNIEGMIAVVCGDRPKWLEIIPEPLNENKEEFILPSKAISTETVLDEWVSHSNIEGLPREKVLKIGQELLSEAKYSLL